MKVYDCFLCGKAIKGEKSYSHDVMLRRNGDKVGRFVRVQGKIRAVHLKCKS